MLLAKVLGTAYALFGAFGLAVVAIRDNRRDMFHDSGREWVGNLRVLHACSVLLSMVACGVAVWVWPATAAYFAWTVLGVLVLGKAVSVASGRGVKCVRCLVMGVALASLATIGIAMGTR